MLVSLGIFLPLKPFVCEIQDRLFTITDDNGIKNFGNGLRVAGAWTDGNDERMRMIALGSPEGNAGKIQDGQDVGIIQLI